MVLSQIALQILKTKIEYGILLEQRKFLQKVMFIYIATFHFTTVEFYKTSL